jgi:deoxyribonuclease V
LIPAAAHRWDLSPAEARQLQEALARQVVLEDRFGAVASVAGVDAGFEGRGRVTRAAVVVMRWPGLEIIEQVVAREPTTFPYVPGLLSFRELPAVLAAFGRLAALPDLVLCDGQGIAHPRRCGIACHLGVLLDIPTIGVGKSRLTGQFEEPGPARGDRSPLLDEGETIGLVLRSRDRVRPLFISPGHRVSLESAADWVLRCTTRYRLPEPIRAADRIASRRGV